MLSQTERICKTSLLILLIFSITESIRVLIGYDLLNTVYVFDAILVLLLIITVIQGIIGIIAWVMLHRDNERGKELFVKIYAVAFGLYALYGLFLLITLLFPKTFVYYPFEFMSIFSLCFLNGAVLLLQHFWTRDLY